MKKFIGLNKERYNQYRYEFCELTKDPQIFQALFYGEFICYNDYCLNKFENYIGSNSYKENKNAVYEMMVSTYIRLRMEDVLRIKNFRSKKHPVSEKVGALIGKTTDMVEGLNRIGFRKRRTDAFLCAMNRFIDGEKEDCDIKAFLSEQARKTTLTYNEFAKLTDKEKLEYFIQEQKNAFSKLESESKFKIPREETLEN